MKPATLALSIAVALAVACRSDAADRAAPLAIPD